MITAYSFPKLMQRFRRGYLILMVIALALPFGNGIAAAQDTTPPTPTDNVRFGYTIHQAVDMGGHIADHSGSSAVYATMVNQHSGPRVLDFSLDMRSVKPTNTFLFDRLTANGFGYGGDPNSVSLLNASKGRIYDFRGSFRRDRQYFDYDLLSNPLIPPASQPFAPVMDSPHLYNTVRRMTDLKLTMAPLSRVSARLGYERNVSEGPSYSTLHYGLDALLLQNWHNTTNNWSFGLDWKPLPQTTVSYDQFVVDFHGKTSYEAAGLNYKLSDGTPVALGVDLSSVWKAPCAAPFVQEGTVNPRCSGMLSYSRSAPTGTLSPVEQLRFQTSSIPKLAINGRLLYSNTKSNLDNYHEYFNGLNARAGLRESDTNGSARVRRTDVNGDLAVMWKISSKLTASNLVDYWNFHVPGTNTFSEVDSAGTSMLAPPGAKMPLDPATDARFLNQKSRTDTIVLAWDVLPQARVSLGYRYRTRLITNDAGDTIPIHENWGIFGGTFRPKPEWRVNLNVDAMYADNSFTRISPRQMQHYRLRSTYNPQKWLMISGSVNVHEARNNVDTVNHLEHARDFSFGTAITPSDKWSIDMNYAYDDVFSSTVECYTSSSAPPNAGVAPQVCIDAGTPLKSTGYYNAPTQFGSLGFSFVPEKRVHFSGGYRMSAVDGHADLMNLRQVPGGLQSQYQSPYGSVAVDIAANWMWKANYNYYGYGEGSPVGPTAPRSFRGNVYTLGVHYAF